MGLDRDFACSEQTATAIRSVVPASPSLRPSAEWRSLRDGVGRRAKARLYLKSNGKNKAKAKADPCGMTNKGATAKATTTATTTGTTMATTMARRVKRLGAAVMAAAQVAAIGLGTFRLAVFVGYSLYE